MSSQVKVRLPEFYRDSVILITGVTGFMGQILLEKILYSLRPKKVYVLVRRKRSESVEQRMEEILQGKLFHRVSQSDLLSRIVPLEIDYSHDNLSLSEDQQQILAAEVQVVFHLMSTVNFVEPLEKAFEINVEYTNRFLSLARSFQHLKVLLYVSTFYSNGDKPLVQEKIYDDISFGGYDNVKSILAQLNAYEKTEFTRLVIGKLPNTYTFSKKCTESMINQKFRDLPIGIFRPPVVTSSYLEPLPGWTNNLNGPCGVMAAIHKGILRAFPTDGTKKCQFAPVDFCVNGLLSCAVDLSRSRKNELTIYNYAENIDDFTWGRAKDILVSGIPFFRRILFGNLLIVFTMSPFLCRMGYAVMRLQARIGDFFLRPKDERRSLRVVTERVIAYAEQLKFFCFNEWRLENGNMRRVVDNLHPEDKLQFPCDIREVDWDHLKTVAPGVVRYVLNRPTESESLQSVRSIIDKN
ncbi:fatty acyl-CoA reductase wat-like [Uranotaenia lowii]|uniref:fatty acyl-CoA reductase wat-like n=1 Tax=Uranotaenia lowii TaxID=190385 RepID=UPI0024789092|nr:fatty acyl-CoA reductase wat-like [Uranotaenia lowii]